MSGPCAKRRVACRIIAPNGSVYWGTNDCENPQAVCPREPGEGYEKCKSVCRQAGHAETEALAVARAAGTDLTGGTAVMFGHYLLCEPCAAALRDAGLRCVTILPQSKP